MVLVNKIGVLSKSVQMMTSSNKPLIIWLSGGPGISASGEGNILMSGPTDENFKPREFSYVHLANVLYVDNPVGSGYSHVYTDHGGSFATNMLEATNDFLALLKGFLKVHPEFEQVPLYLVGEGYGGKMGPVFAQRITQEVTKATLRANLKGIGMVYPDVQLLRTIGKIPDTLFYAGIVDVPGKEELDKMVMDIMDSAFGHRWLIAAQRNEALIRHIIKTYNVDINRFTDNTPQVPLTFDLNNFMDTKVSPILNITGKFGIQREFVSQSMTDILKDVIPNVSYLLDRTDVKIAILSGQLDWIINTVGTYAWVSNLFWHGKTAFNKAPREPFYVKGIHEGHYREYDKLSFYWIKRAGHKLPNDNPHATKYILERLISD